jgi:DNA-binding transcriptional regulator YhcF (GntR family)
MELKEKFDSLPKDFRIAFRWGGDTELFRDGFLVVPTRFLRGYTLAKSALTTSEAMLLLVIMTFKWSDEAPYPSYDRLGQIMGVSSRMIGRYAKSLEKKGYVRLTRRRGTSSTFDLDPLFRRIPRMPMTRSEDEAAIASRAAEQQFNEETTLGL